MTRSRKSPDVHELKPKIIVCGVGGAGGNAVNNMIQTGLEGVEFVVANTDAQALSISKAEHILQMGLKVTSGLGAGSRPEVGRAAAEEAIEDITNLLQGAHMIFITAGMGGGTGTGAAPVLAQVARELNILTVGVVTKPFEFEGQKRMLVAEQGITELQKCVDTLIVIPNQNLFRIANERTTFADAFALADQVLYSGVACITDLMVKEGLINLDFADVRAVMRDMGRAMMGTGQSTGEGRALTAAQAAVANPLLDETSMKGAKGLLISITGGSDLTLYEVDEAATRIREEVDSEANIIVGATFDNKLEGQVRVSVVATGITSSAASNVEVSKIKNYNQKSTELFATIVSKHPSETLHPATELSLNELTSRMKNSARSLAEVAFNSQDLLAPSGNPPTTLKDTVLAGNHQALIEEELASLLEASTLDSNISSALVEDPKPHHLPEDSVVEDFKTNLQAPSVSSPSPQELASSAGNTSASVRTPRMPRLEDLPLLMQQQILERQNQHFSPTQSSVKMSRQNLLKRLTSLNFLNKIASPSMIATQSLSLDEMTYPSKDLLPNMPAVSVSKKNDDFLEIPAFLRRKVR